MASKFYLSYLVMGSKLNVHCRELRDDGSRVAHTFINVPENVIRCEIGDEAMSYFAKIRNHLESSTPFSEAFIKELKYKRCDSHHIRRL